MTTNRTLESDLKFTKLNNLNKITVTDEWLTNIINAARAYMVNEIVTVGEGEAARPGVKLDRGNLFLLLKARVFQDEEGDFPNGDEEVRYGPYTTDEDGHYTGTAWSESFTASMEQTLWSMCYAALGDAMRTRMTKKFDKERTGGGPPLGTELLRFIQSKTQMLDARVQERKAKKDFDKHAASNMPDGVTTEEMDTWCDTLVALNEKRDNPAEEHELIELTIEAFPESIFDKIEAAHEHHAEHEDYDAARAVWAGVIERHAGREDKRAADKAMRAAEAPPAPAAPVVDAQVAALTKQVEALTALVTKVCVPVGANADSAAVAAAVAAAAATKTNTNPVQPCCGRRHAGTAADCWFLHPNLIVKALYGLAVSGQAWNREINEHLTTPREKGGMGFTRCAADPCMYVRRDGEDWALIGLATDNCFHLESSDAVHADVLASLQSKYEWIDEGLISDVPAALGTRTVQDLEAGTVSISIEGYIDALAETFADVVGKRRVSTPATQELEKHVIEALLKKEEARDPATVKWFQRLVGCLIFASIVCRPDISWAVGMLSRVMCYPTPELMRDAVRVLNYLVQHRNLALTYSRSTYFSVRSGATEERAREDAWGVLSAVFALDEASSDSDFAAGPSVSGFEGRMAGAAVFWGSRRQSSTMLDSASAELVAGSVAATNLMYQRNLLGELGWAQARATRLYMDNKATVALAHNPMSFSKTKHVARRHHYLRECVESGDIDCIHVPTDYNCSDIFTKSLPPKKFRLFRAALMNLGAETLR